MSETGTATDASDMEVDSPEIKTSSVASGSSASAQVVDNGDGEVNSSGEQPNRNTETASAKPSTPPPRHHTRSRNGQLKKADEEEQSGAEESDSEDIDINEVAQALAFLDKRALARSQAVRVNRLFDELVFPMCFPWAHPCGTKFVSVPHDIDHLPALFQPDDEDSVEEEVTNIPERAEDGSYMAVERSADPGVLELITYEKDGPEGAKSIANGDPRAEDSELPGEMSLRMMQAVASRKRKKNALAVTNEYRETKKLRVSVKFGGSSSRKTIIDEDSCPMVLAALLPKICQDGARKRGADAHALSMKLGSYNCRLASGPLNFADWDPKHRFWVGRTRVLWTLKDVPSRNFTRPSYYSLLTGKRVEGANHKRPLMLKLVVRLNGRVMCTNPKQASEYYPQLKKALAAESESQVRYDELVVEDALDDLTEPMVQLGGKKEPSRARTITKKPVCRLNLENFTSNLLNVGTDTRSVLLRKQEIPLTLSKKLSLPGIINEEANLEFTRPRIDVLPTEDGQLHVWCSKPGKFDWSFTPSPSLRRARPCVDSVLLHQLALDKERCVVCWQGVSKLETEEIVKCSSCGIKLHQKCANTESDIADWICQPCKTLQAGTKGAVCRICGLACDEGTSYHEICKAWVGDVAKNPPKLTEEKASCHLCSAGSRHIISCAASNCAVQFHPMCGVIASMLAEENTSEMNKLQVDAHRCTQYTLCSAVVTHDATRVCVPVAFCGIHNPKRSKEYVGLYPAGANLQGAMSVPQM